MAGLQEQPLPWSELVPERRDEVSSSKRGGGGKIHRVTYWSFGYGPDSIYHHCIRNLGYHKWGLFISFVCVTVVESVPGDKLRPGRGSTQLTGLDDHFGVLGGWGEFNSIWSKSSSQSRTPRAIRQGAYIFSSELRNHCT